MPDFLLESQHGGLVAGVDEVGRGPLAGPVVAAALIFSAAPTQALAQGLDDSKKLSAPKREALYAALRADPTVTLALGAASVDEIARYNILHASHIAMRRALARLAVRPALALIDGNRVPDGLCCPAKAVIGGDGLSLSIAGASIAAKVVRDRLMVRLAQRHGGYAWERNAGYGTAAHLAGMKNLGVSPHHRTDFAPVRACIAAREVIAA